MATGSRTWGLRLWGRWPLTTTSRSPARPLPISNPAPTLPPFPHTRTHVRSPNNNLPLSYVYTRTERGNFLMGWFAAERPRPHASGAGSVCWGCTHTGDCLALGKAPFGTRSGVTRIGEGRGPRAPTAEKVGVWPTRPRGASPSTDTGCHTQASVSSLRDRRRGGGVPAISST